MQADACNFRFWLTVWYCHVTYEFHSESTLYSSLNVKEILALNRRDIWSLSYSNGIWTHNHLVLPNWPKWVSLGTKWLLVVGNRTSPLTATEKGIFKNFVKLTGKHLYHTCAKACNLLKKRLRHRWFLVSFEKVLRISILYHTSVWLLLFDEAFLWK